MTFEANVVNVLIASPRDTTEYRDAVESALHQWNADRAQGSSVVLLPLRWEVNAVPVMSDSPQAAINKQLIERADVVIGVFWARLGQPTDAYPSGTVEEILEARDAGKHVHVYFSSAPVPQHQLDPAELIRLAEVKKDLGERGLYAEFASADDLKTRIRAAIEHDLGELDLAASPSVRRRAGSVALRASYHEDREPKVDSRGRPGFRTRNQRIVVTNDGNLLARAVRLSLEPTDGGDLPLRMDAMNEPHDIPPKGTFSYPLFVAMGVAHTFTITFTWLDERGREQTSSHSLSLQ